MVKKPFIGLNLIISGDWTQTRSRSKNSVIENTPSPVSNYKISPQGSENPYPVFPYRSNQLKKCLLNCEISSREGCGRVAHVKPYPIPRLFSARPQSQENFETPIQNLTRFFSTQCGPIDFLKTQKKIFHRPYMRKKNI